MKSYHLYKINPKHQDKVKQGNNLIQLKRDNFVRIGLVDYVITPNNELIPVSEFFELERRQK